MFSAQKITREDFNYLNMSEIKDLAKEFKIPVYIHYEDDKGSTRKTAEIESKIYLLNRLYLYFREKKIAPKLIYKKRVTQMNSKKKNFFPEDFVLYGEFKSTNAPLKKELERLTGDKFRFGALAFIEAHKLWRKGVLCTLKDFAEIWLIAREKQAGRPRDEWAYMKDVSEGFKRSEWKEY